MVREEVRIEAGGGVLAANPEYPAPLRRLGLSLPPDERERSRGGGGASELEQLSAADGGRC